MVDTSTIPPFKNKIERVHHNGSTQDIISTILQTDAEQGNELCKFSRQFADGENGLKRLFNFVRDNIQYKVDATGTQDIKTPPALWGMGYGDCKSKTIFITSVLSCLKIPYIFRFTRYDKGGTDMRHVYPIAYFNGRAIPMDTVYKKYGKEKKFVYKIDYEPMTKINKISGCEEPSTAAPRILKYRNHIQDLVYTSSDLAQKKLVEIKQKQRYVPKSEPIPFNKISDGVASLMIAKQELKTIAAMKPELKEICNKGLNLIDKAIKGDCNLTGDIPKQLDGLCRKIITARKMVAPANSHGFRAKRLQKLMQERNGDMDTFTPNVGAFPERLCLKGLWFSSIPTNTFGYGVQDMTANNGFCTGQDLADLVNMPIPNFAGDTFGENTFLFYGRNSQYRQNLKNGLSTFNAGMDALSSGNNPLFHGRQGYSVWINNNLDYDAALEYFATNSDVLSSYLNDIYKQDPNGSMGSGLFYTFTGGVTDSGQPVNPNLFPASVIAKGLRQNDFIDSCTTFSGVSRSNIQGLARNGILYDNGGEQPEQTLSTLLRLHNTGTPAIGDGGVTAIIAAIAAAIIAIVAAVAEAVATANKAENQAKAIDTSAADTARLSGFGTSNMPTESDWSPISQKRGGDDKGGNMLPLIIAAGLGMYALTMDSDKDKKKAK